MIRDMKLKDVMAVHKIEEQSFSTPWTVHAFETEMENPRAHYIVFELEDKIIGYGGFWQVLDEGHFTNLAIDPKYRGQGYGKQLIKAMMFKGKSLGINKVTLEVRASNETALKAYKDVGFYIEGRRSRYYDKPIEDAMIMWASLN